MCDEFHINPHCCRYHVDAGHTESDGKEIVCVRGRVVLWDSCILVRRPVLFDFGPTTSSLSALGIARLDV